METAIRGGAAVAEIEARLAPAEAALAALVAALRRRGAARGRGRSGGGAGRGPGGPACGGRPDLEELLSQDAVEAIDVFDKEAPLLTAAFGDRAAEIRKLVKGYRFEDALAVLRAVRNRGALSGPGGGNVGVRS